MYGIRLPHPVDILCKDDVLEALNLSIQKELWEFAFQHDPPCLPS